ncbi:hypothetical protein SAMN02745126_06497 [Enhydrobacter aerosaccus]|uniref:Uncharacterized protein n=1 Tax=Enhydrobacter aerosaccus TaxID=225324 RepID=A0A1T4TMB4_9HYPH|nr:hypothetical protein [Enhydrobacter aerosaccus]SKA41359.1 hypothetical protein SAMN02745126_06497 [Enhydrobacter aerosaccus]
MSIRLDGQAYRRGVVFGFTVAEVVLLLVFCLLLLFMPVLLSETSRRTSTASAAWNSTADATKSAAKSIDDNSAPSKVGSPSDSQRQASREPKPRLPEDWKVLVPEGAGQGREEGPNGPRDTKMAPPTGQPMPGLTLDGICRKLGIPVPKCTAANAEELLHNAGKHNWPPIIPLKEADGYYFVVGSAEPSSDFRDKLISAVIPEIMKYAAQFQTDVIEVVGHTDEQPIKGLSSNIDTTMFDVLLRGESAAKMGVADNAGLGFARAAAIVQVLRQDNRLSKMTVLPLSAAQVVDINGKLADGTSNGDVKQRRRIEIRLRQSDPAAPR